MKHITGLATGLLLVIFQSAAQIVIVSGDMPQVGDTVRNARDTMVTGITIGSAGVNRTWDFSGVTPDVLVPTYVQDPSSTPDGGSFPNSNLSLTQNFSEYVYVDLSTQAYTVDGLTGDYLGIGLPLVVVLNPTYDLYRFPTQYGNSFSGTYGFTQNVLAANLPPDLRNAIQSQLPPGATLIQIRATYTSDYTDEIDGWGTTITPICSYPSLRQKRTEDVHLVVDAQINYGFTFWVNGAVDSMFSTTNYNWLAKETKMPLVAVTFDDQNNINTVTYSLIPPTLTADFVASQTSICPGEAITFSDLSEGCPDSWQWTFSGGTPSASTMSNPGSIVYNTPSTYSVSLEVTNSGNSDVETKTMYITVNAPPSADAGENDTICIGQTGSLTASGGVSYDWNTGFSGSTLTDSPLSTNTYSVTVTDGNGCTASDMASIIVNPLPVADAGLNDTVCQGETGSLTASGGISYQWDNGASGAILSDAPASTTTYTVTVTDQNGCSDTDNATIAVKPVPVVDAGANDTTCAGDGTVLTASGGVTYAWNTGDNTAAISVSPVTTTIYTVTATGVNGCTASDNATVVVNPLPGKNLSDQSICFGSTTVLDAGNPGASYNWSTGVTTRTISVNTGGQFSVTVTDQNGCVSADTSTVTVGANLTVSLQDAEFCQGDSAILNAGNPGTDHLWSTGDTLQTITVFNSGVYSVTVTDDVGCTGEDSSTVTVNPLPTVDAGANDTICAGDMGTLTATGTGSLVWNNGTNGANLTDNPLQTTTYMVTATDSNGCSAADAATIVVNPLPIADAGENDTICFGETGMLIASGAPDFLWNEGTTTATLTDDPAVTTTYNVTVTDANGCTASDIAQIVVNPLPDADAGPDESICIGDSVTLTASGGTDYTWSNGQMVQSFIFSPAQSTAYSVTVTDSNGCSVTDSVTVTVNLLPSVTLAGLDSQYCPYNIGDTLTGLPAGGSYLGNGIQGIAFNPSMANPGLNTITYVYTDSLGCTSSDSLITEVYTATVVEIGNLLSSYCANGEPVGVGLTPAGGTLSGLEISGTDFDPVEAGEGGPYTITYAYTDSNGCLFTDTSLVVVDSVPVVSITALDSVYCQDDDPVTLAGVPAGGSFTGPGITGNTFDPAQAPTGTSVITYEYTDGNGCGDVSKANVMVEICEGISNISLTEVKIQPNPVEQVLNIILNEHKERIVVSLFDALGKQVLTAEMAAGQAQTQIDVSKLDKGIYFLKIGNRNVNVTRKIMVL